MPALLDLIAVLERLFDPRWAESWDAVGLVCGDPDEPVERVLLAVDAVPSTVAEAVATGAQLLLTHHPLLLTPVHGVPADDPKGALVHRMIRSGVAHYVAHTNAELARPGVSDALADAVGLLDVGPLRPADDEEPLRPATATSEPVAGSDSGSDLLVDAPSAGRRGVGRIGRLPVAESLSEFTARVAAALPATAGGVRAAGDPQRRIEHVALLAGSGSSLVDAARAAGADVLLSADFKHHHGIEAVTQRPPGAMALVEAAHWATEVPWLHATATRLRGHFGATVTFTVSGTVTDPWTVHRPSPTVP